MTAEEYDAEIAGLTASQEEIWANSLAKFLEMRSCGLGLCVTIDALETVAHTADTAEKREVARLSLERERADRELPWQMAARAVEQLEITKATLKRRREGLR